MHFNFDFIGFIVIHVLQFPFLSVSTFLTHGIGEVTGPSSFVFKGIKVTVDLRCVFWGKPYSALCINGKYINLYIIGELI